MRSARRLAIPILAASLAAAPLRNSEHDAIFQSDWIIAGDIASSRLVRAGPFIDCRATVLLVRTLRGPSRPAGTRIEVHWEFSPPDDSPLPPIEGTRALWFLKRSNPSQPYEAMWAAISSSPLGGYFVPIPKDTPRETEPPGPRRLAAELVFDMETVARQAGARLDVPPPPNTTGRLGTEWFSPSPGFTRATSHDPARDQFQSLADLFQQLDPNTVRDFNLRLIGEPSVHLQAIGLRGELLAGNTDAIFGLARIYRSLNRVWMLSQPTLWMARINLGNNRAAVRAVGEMCVSAGHVGNFEMGAVSALAAARSAIAVPYLAVMLHHPWDSIRNPAALGICEAFASDATLRPVMDSRLLQTCSLGTVAANRIGNHAFSLAPST